jgi:hypothetical protein
MAGVGQVLEHAPRPTLVHCPHPVLATAGRTLHREPVGAGESVQAYLRRLKLHPGERPALLTLDDVRIPREAWARTYPEPGQLLVLRAGLDGGEGSDPLRVALSIAVLLVAPQAGGAVGSALGVSASLGTTLVTVGGMLLVNALVPIEVPDVAGPQADDESPTYGLTGGSNRARLEAPMPLVLGRHRVTPDLGAQPYAEFIGEDQVLSQIFHFGLTDVLLSDYRIGDTPLSDYQGVEVEESGADGALTLFPGNVDTAAGAELNIGDPPVLRTSPLDATALAVEITGYLFYLGNTDLETLNAQVTIEYRELGGPSWLPLGDAASLTLSSSSRAPVRRGVRRSVPRGQYEVRVQLTGATRGFGQAVSPGDPKATLELSWSSLRSYQPDDADYDGQKRLALRITASGQLQGVVDQFNAIASTRVPVWDGANWTTQESQNPAWLFLYFARGRFVGGRRIWGAGLADERIDIAAIQEWGAWCDLKGLSCSLVLDASGTSVLQALSLIARCGRASTSWGSGRLGVVWDAGGQPAVGHFGMHNIREGSFRIEYLTGRLADEVVVRYMSPELGWKPDSVRARVPGVTTPENSATVDVPGIIDRDQAGREANLLAAQQVHRRRRITWETDLEGSAVQRGDVVELSHDLTRWAYSGRLLTGTPTTLTLDRAVPFTTGLDHYIGIRQPDGTYTVHGVQYPGTEAEQLTLLDPLGVDPSADPDHPPLDYTWHFAPAPTPGKRVKVLDVQPIDEQWVRLTATDEDDAYYLSEFGAYDYTPAQASGTAPTLANLEVSDTLYRAGDSFSVRVVAVWDVAGDYAGAIVRAAPAGEPLAVVERTLGRRAEFDWRTTGLVDIEVTLLNRRGEYGPSGRATLTHSIVGKAAPPADVLDFAASARSYGIALTWAPVPDADLLDYEVRAGTDWDTGVTVGRIDGTELALDIVAQGSYDFLIKARDTSRNLSANAAAASITIEQPLAVGELTAGFTAEALVLDWGEPPASFPVAEYEVRHGADWATATVVTRVDARQFTARAQWLGLRTWWVAAVDSAGNVGAPASVAVSVAPATVSAIAQRVIDNYVQLTWDAAPGTLPIAHYDVHRGEDYATAERLGSVSATILHHFEVQQGEYVYWVTPVDSAGNAGTPAQARVAVSEPPDFILRTDWISAWGGTLSNAAPLDSGGLLVPVNTTETWATHFSSRAWATIAEQVAAGFPNYAMPAEGTAFYEEVFDYGTVLAGTLVTAVLSRELIAGEVTITPTIAVRALDTDPWTEHPGLWQVFETDFRYVRVRLDFAAAGGDDLLRLNELRVRLSVKEKTDQGRASCAAGDAGGTAVTFSKAFVDVQSIDVQPIGTAAVIAVVDFAGTPNPTTFSVYLFDRATGARVSGDVFWIARGN